jgi:heme exporter protein A
MALFEARNLACRRGERLLFQLLDFSVASGEALVLTGANGAGKSSLLRLAAGLIRPAAGEFSWDGRVVRPHADQHRRRLIYLGHMDALKANLTPRENLRFWADLAGLSSGQAVWAVEQALEEDHLWALADLPARFLSAGQRRRLALSRLRLQSPSATSLWLLDEPTNALDGEAKQRLLDLLRQHLIAGGLMVLASHDLLPELPGQRLAVDVFAPKHADDPADAVRRDLGEAA